MIRAVLDTNTVISAQFWRGSPWRVYDSALEEKYIVLASEALILELDDVLHRQKFIPLLAMISKTADQLIAEYRNLAEAVEPVQVPDDVIRDPRDRIVLACAVGGKADCIVSGDKDPLVLSIYENIPILNAVQFLEQLSAQ